ncbi:MAG: aspartyl/asparaginyl beta-hydroxylase domain-containing protein [Gemmataceae bacterium]|nr:aspartyl/asparaginyl beta-hydroxylase domain-containing protein [Gemmataceae bacterium]
MYRHSKDYPFTRVLEEHWQEILAEYGAVSRNQGMHAWPEKQLYDGQWDTFGLYAFGNRRHRNCDLCPVTTRLVEQIPGLQMAGFSRLAPGTHIKPHCGYDGWAQYVLRCHLALQVNDQCALRVGPETRKWETGKTLVFCDATEHEAWNHGDKERVVLLLDFRNPEFHWRLLNPDLTPEIQKFIQETWGELTFREKASYYFWRALRLWPRRRFRRPA